MHKIARGLWDGSYTIIDVCLGSELRSTWTQNPTLRLCQLSATYLQQVTGLS